MALERDETITEPLVTCPDTSAMTHQTLVEVPNYETALVDKPTMTSMKMLTRTSLCETVNRIESSAFVVQLGT